MKTTHRRFKPARGVILTAFFLVTAHVATARPAAPRLSNSQHPSSGRPSPANARIMVPAGTTILLALVRPVRARSAAPGQIVYAETISPVLVASRVAIPPGTYVQARIDAMAPPRWLTPRAWFLIHFTKMIFAKGYVVRFPSPWDPSLDGVFPAVATPYVAVTSTNDILLDNGTQIRMVLQIPLRLDARRVEEAVRASKPVNLAAFTTASQCVPIPATPGLPTTVIPGTPGTSATVIPGTPGTPEIPCPRPPIVLPQGEIRPYRETFRLKKSLRLAGVRLSPGNYVAAWSGPSPVAVVEIERNARWVATVKARVVLLARAPPASALETRRNPDGSLSLVSLRFAGKDFALFFD
jgi:hypothetical protein